MQSVISHTELHLLSILNAAPCITQMVLKTAEYNIFSVDKDSDAKPNYRILFYTLEDLNSFKKDYLINTIDPVKALEVIKGFMDDFFYLTCDGEVLPRYKADTDAAYSVTQEHRDFIRALAGTP